MDLYSETIIHQGNAIKHVELIPVGKNYGEQTEINSFMIEPAQIILDNKLEKEAAKINGEEIRCTSEEDLITGRERKRSILGNLEIVWKDITIKTIPQNNCIGKTINTEKIILNKVNGKVKSGECLAILGSSGAGKTTLLNYLSQKIENKNLKIAGELLLNNQKVERKKFELITSYVMQDDILEANMTPLEILMFTAKLKLSLPEKDIEERVKSMIDDLHLNQCQHTFIGNSLQRGVSGGERKRTSIAVDLISDPKIIFLDEPTTGLDSYNAYEVITLLKKISKKGKIVIFTIHQPCSEIFSLLEKICILALGKTVYFGSSEKCIDAFEKFGLPVPNNYNPFEHFMEVTNVTSIKDEKIINSYPELNEITDNLEKYECYVSTLNSIYEKTKDEYDIKTTPLVGFSEENQKLFEEKNVQKSFFFYFSMLVARNVIITKRNPKMLNLKVIQTLISAVLLSIIFARLSKDFSGIQDRVGLILITIIHIIAGSVNSTILIFFDERKVFTRERSGKLYSVSAYFLSKSISELPLFFICANIFSIIVYLSTELNDSFSYKYYIFTGILHLCNIGGLSYAFFLGSLVNNQSNLVVLFNAINPLLILLSGFFANADNFAPYLIPIKYLSLYKYGFQTLTHNEFNELKLNCFNLDPTSCSPLVNRFTFLEPFYISLIAFGCLIVFFKLFAFIFVKSFAKIKV